MITIGERELLQWPLIADIKQTETNSFSFIGIPGAYKGPQNTSSHNYNPYTSKCTSLTVINNVYKYVNQIIKWNTNSAPFVDCHFIIKATKYSHGPQVAAWSWKASEGHPWPDVNWFPGLGLLVLAARGSSVTHTCWGVCSAKARSPPRSTERQPVASATSCLSPSGTLRKDSETTDSIYNSECLECPIRGPSRIVFLFSDRTGNSIEIISTFHSYFLDRARWLSNVDLGFRGRESSRVLVYVTIKIVQEQIITARCIWPTGLPSILNVN